MMLQMRLDVLESFLSPVPVQAYTTTKINKRKNKSVTKNRIPEDIDHIYGLSGELIIIDLTNPVLGPEIVCTLFEIAANQFVASTPGGKVIALDEAHTVRMLFTSAGEFVSGRIDGSRRLVREAYY
jgi:hypothetical protein